jgi:hypothetical protein
VPTTAWKSAGTGANDAGVGDAAWSNPGNITASNDTRATSATMGAGQTTQILRATNFGFSTSDVPTGATVVGIEVGIERQRNSTGGNQVVDNVVRLRTSSGQVGNNKADTGTNWPNNDAEVVYGGAADTWAASLTDSAVRGSDFGVDIRAARSGGTVASAGVDHVQIRITYTVAAMEAAGTDGLGVADSGASTRTAAAAGADSLGAADAGDAEAGGDDPGDHGSHPNTLYESHTQTKGRGGPLAGLAAAGADSLGVADAAAGLVARIAAGADSLGAADAATRAITASRAGADSLGTADSGAALRSLVGAGADALGTADAAGTQLAAAVIGADSLGADDASSATIGEPDFLPAWVVSRGIIIGGGVL